MNSIVLSWTDAVLDLAEALAEMPEQAYLVGGAVRDAILRRNNTDLDIVTPQNGIRLARRIANAFQGDFYPLDETRDLGRAIIPREGGRLIIDVSGLRAGDLTGDLADRDFTVNAMAVDLTGDVSMLIDPLGGAGDLIAKRLRRCSPDALANDPVRVLRAVRQSVQFGLHIDRETLRDMKMTVTRLSEVSPERMRDELIKLLSLDRVQVAIRIADAIGALEVVLPELTPLHGLPQAPPHVHDGWTHSLAVVEALNDIVHTVSHKRTDDSAAQFNLGMVVIAFDRFRPALQAHLERTGTDERPRRALLMLAALLHDTGKGLVARELDAAGYLRYTAHEAIGADALAARLLALRLSNNERKYVTSLVRQHMDQTVWQDALAPLDIYRFWRMMGEDGIDLILLSLADYLGVVGHTYNQAVWLKLIEKAQILLDGYFNQRDRLIDPPALLDGEVLMQHFGLKPSPIVGGMLEAIRQSQVEGSVTNFHQAIALAGRMLRFR
ncbi:MAG: HD domain-containing protein [Chloroflexota bacterium]|nr:HD domain-containing protein [Chloroflexota bacterium]